MKCLAVFAIVVSGISAQEVPSRAQRLAKVLALEDARVADASAWERCLAEDDPELLPFVVRGLGRVGDPALQAVFQRWMEQAPTPWSSELQVAASLAAGLLGNPDALEALVTRVSPVNAARALGLVGRLPEDPERATRVWKALTEIGDASTDEAVEALLTFAANVEDPRVLGLAQKYLDPEGSRRKAKAALYFFSRQRREATPLVATRIAAWLGDEDAEIAAWAAQALARVGRGFEDGARRLAKLSLDEAPSIVRIDRVRALGSWPLDVGREALLSALKSDAAPLRRTALEVVGRQARSLEEKDRVGLAAFSQAMADDDPDVDVRRAALEVLGALDPEALRRWVIRHRLDAPWAVRVGAASGFRHVEWKDADVGSGGAVTVLASDPDRRVRLTLLEAALVRLQDDRPKDVGRMLRGLGVPLEGDATSLRFHEADPVCCGVLAQVFVAARAVKDAPNNAVSDAVLLAFLEHAMLTVPKHHIEPLQAVVDLAASLDHFKTRELLRHCATSPELSIRRRAAGALLARRIVVPHLPGPERDFVALAETLLQGSAHQATVRTNRGVLRVELHPREAPLTVARFTELAAAGYFDGLLFHRVVPAFVAQAGCPRGDGYGAPDASLRCEINGLTYERGSLGMALAGKDTGGSQWFFAHRRLPHLDFRYTIFGRLVLGFEVLDRLVPGDTILGIEVIVLAR